MKETRKAAVRKVLEKYQFLPRKKSCITLETIRLMEEGECFKPVKICAVESVCPCRHRKKTFPSFLIHEFVQEALYNKFKKILPFKVPAELSYYNKLTKVYLNRLHQLLFHKIKDQGSTGLDIKTTLEDIPEMLDYANEEIMENANKTIMARINIQQELDGRRISFTPRSKDGFGLKKYLKKITAKLNKLISLIMKRQRKTEFFLKEKQKTKEVLKIFLRINAHMLGMDEHSIDDLNLAINRIGVTDVSDFEAWEREMEVIRLNAKNQVPPALMLERSEELNAMTTANCEKKDIYEKFFSYFRLTPDDTKNFQNEIDNYSIIAGLANATFLGQDVYDKVMEVLIRRFHSLLSLNPLDYHLGRIVVDHVPFSFHVIWLTMKTPSVIFRSYDQCRSSLSENFGYFASKRIIALSGRAFDNKRCYLFQMIPHNQNKEDIEGFFVAIANELNAQMGNRMKTETHDVFDNLLLLNIIKNIDISQQKTPKKFLRSAQKTSEKWRAMVDSMEPDLAWILKHFSPIKPIVDFLENSLIFGEYIRIYVMLLSSLFAKQKPAYYLYLNNFFSFFRFFVSKEQLTKGIKMFSACVSSVCIAPSCENYLRAADRLNSSTSLLLFCLGHWGVAVKTRVSGLPRVFERIPSVDCAAFSDILDPFARVYMV
jgi:hypothetical protein